MKSAVVLQIPKLRDVDVPKLLVPLADRSRNPTPASYTDGYSSNGIVDGAAGAMTH